MVDPKKQIPGGGPPFSGPDDQSVSNSSADDFFHRRQPEMRRPQPSQAAVSVAFQAMQRLAAESGVDGILSDSANEADNSTTPCEICGHRNRAGNQFCGMCGLALRRPPDSPSAEPQAPESERAPDRPPGQHHYHHHYHHHSFASSPDASMLTGRSASQESPVRDAPRFRAPGAPGTMSRAESAVRKVTQDWIVACNSRQLDDLVSTYSLDAIVLRPNHPAIRGTAAIREFFFAVLDAGLGEVELETLRVDVVGDTAYEAGRCKMLVPVAVGKRREERGKYLTALARQPNGEWKIVADCWSTDLSLTPTADADTARPGSVSAPPKPLTPRKP